MKTFSCSCGQRLFFENSVCLRCNRRVGFAPELRRMLTSEGVHWEEADGTAKPYLPCRNTSEYRVCNWLVAVGDEKGYCLSCRLNRTIPNLTVPANLTRWKNLESAKRRMIYGLLQLQLPFAQPANGQPPRPQPDFR